MPACTTETLSHLWQSTSKETLRAGLDTSNGSSPNSCSPPTKSPISELRRARSATPTSPFFNKEFKIRSRWRSSHALIHTPPESPKWVAPVIGWYPCFLLRVLQAVLTMLLPAVILQGVLWAPRVAIKMAIGFWWWCFDIPMGVLKIVVGLMRTPVLDYTRKKRTVLIGGGGSLQALHLARGFHAAGARVVVCEVEGVFPLARFSTAVSRFYTLPAPGTSPRQYIQALMAIAEREAPMCYVPVCHASTAHNDALAKPMLELLGCQCLCPGARESTFLDDPAEFTRRCRELGVGVVKSWEVRDMDEVGEVRGVKGEARVCGEGAVVLGGRVLKLPRQVKELEMLASDARPWLIQTPPPGRRYTTCTTIKNSKLISNITCETPMMKTNRMQYTPVDEHAVTHWLELFFNRLNPLRPLTGIVSFDLIVPEGTEEALAICCKVGVPASYLCHTEDHARLLWPPCRHFSRQSSGPLVAEGGRYVLHDAVWRAVRRPCVAAVSELVQTVCSQSDALFVVWDPLPYLVYCTGLVKVAC